MTWIADETVDLNIAVYDNAEREFTDVCTYRAVIGCGLPPNTCMDIPERIEGFAAVRSGDDTNWIHVVDHRGETVYSTKTGDAILVDGLGDYPPDTTVNAPATKHDKWDAVSARWVTDTDAQKVEMVSQAESQKAQLAAAAEQSIRPLERAKQLGIATAEELAALTEWERYSVFLMRVDISKAPDIDWPVVPTV